MLVEAIQGLATPYALGKMVSSRPDYLYTAIRKWNSSYGHILVYRSETNRVGVLRIFHSAQNWQQILADQH